MKPTMTLAQVRDKLRSVRNDPAGNYLLDEECELLADAVDANLAERDAILLHWRPLLDWAIGTIEEFNGGPLTVAEFSEDAGLYFNAKKLLAQPSKAQSVVDRLSDAENLLDRMRNGAFNIGGWADDINEYFRNRDAMIAAAPKVVI